MARLSTSRKRKRKTSTNIREINLIEQVTDVAAQYVKEWASDRARTLLSRDSSPLIIPTNNGFYVGRYLVITKKGIWIVYRNKVDFVDSFYHKKSAMAYAVCEHLGQYQKSREIANMDHAVSKLELDLRNYLHRRQKASKSQDITKILILEARITETKLLLDSRKNQLEKILNSAKYMKIWDK